jgi:hypothetical protein
MRGLAVLLAASLAGRLRRLERAAPDRTGGGEMSKEPITTDDQLAAALNRVHDALDAASGHEVPGQRVDRAGLVQAEATYALARVVEIYGRLLMNRIDRIDSVLTEIKSQMP